MSGTAILILGIALLAFMIIGAVAEPIYNHLSSDGGHARRLGAFYDERRAAGIGYAATGDEYYLRVAMAKLRRQASDAVRANPAKWGEILEEQRKAIGDEIARERPDLIKSFAASVTGLSYGQILYPEEAAMVDRQFGLASYRPSQDEVAALRIVDAG